MQTGKKILLVERLIGTEKRREIYIISEYMILVNSKLKKILAHLALSCNT